jgi:hypothetical protein
MMNVWMGVVHVLGCVGETSIYQHDEQEIFIKNQQAR